jgi:acyl-CoA synthetase (AMP-forming)/AMP-acid ligase II
MITTSMAMAEAFRQVASGHPRREALVCGKVRATYGQMVDRITALAWGLDRLGIGKGDKVAAALPPSPEFVYLFFALAELGAVIVPINPQLRHGQLSHLLRDSEPVAVVTSGWLGTAEGRRMIEDVQSEVPGLRYVISAEGGTGAHLSLADLLSTEPDSPYGPPDGSPDDLLALLYTSGTTGVPKGTMHSHQSLMTPVIASLKIR